MTLTAFLLTYLFGGLTFLPLVVAVVLIPAWLALPRADDQAVHDGGDELPGVGHGEELLKGAVPPAEDQEYTLDGAASGTFAVLRRYNFQNALAALSARNNAGNASATNGSTDGAAETTNPSESVYQSMYRSVFDRNKNANSPGTSLLENDDTAAGNTAKVKRQSVGANVFYIVLRHGHLMLYDSPAQLEVRHVISLAHHTISLSENSNEQIIEPDLFIKRTAIVLTPAHLPNGHLQSPLSASRPFFLFSALCSEKEDFYHSLLNSRISPPVPRALFPEDAIKLQRALHSTSLTPETRAFNALLGRIFLALHRAPDLENFVRRIMEKKIARVQKPTFIAALAVKSIDLGDAAPTLSNPRLKDLNISGDLTLSFDLRYNGGLKVVISALAKLDLGSRFKARTVDLVLATSLQRMQAHVLVHIKPPPSNRIWFCFDNMPDMDIKVEPVVSQRQITYSFILKAIEDRIRAVIADTLVNPNCDDVPFFDTRQQRVRGGIWSDEGGANDSPAKLPVNPRRHLSHGGAELLTGKTEKTMSMPSLPPGDGATSVLSSASDHIGKPAIGTSALAKDQSNNLKRRSVASLPLQSPASATIGREHMRPSPPPKPLPLRSPSLTSPSPSAPSVAIDDATVQPVRSDDLNLRPKKWRSHSSQHAQNRRDAVEAVREMRNRSQLSEVDDASVTDLPSQEMVDDGDLARSVAESDEIGLGGHEASERRRSSHTSNIVYSSSGIGNTSPRGFDSPRRSDSGRSTATNSMNKHQQQRKTILAATAAATSAARNWSWNAIANRTKGSPVLHGSTSPLDSQSHAEQTAPIGRGQPLPPPGMPLARPQRGIWNNAGLGGMTGSVKRKPMLPARKSTQIVHEGPKEGANGRQSEVAGEKPMASDVQDAFTPADEAEAVAEAETECKHEDDFGPWRENSGTQLFTESHQVDEPADLDDAPRDVVTPSGLEYLAKNEQRDSRPSKPKVPPPLPKRRKPVPEPSQTKEEGATGLSAASIPVTIEDGNATRDHGYAMEVEPGPPAHDEAGDGALAEEESELEVQAKFLEGESVGEEDFESEQESEEPDAHEKGHTNGSVSLDVEGGGHEDRTNHSDHQVARAGDEDPAVHVRERYGEEEETEASAAASAVLTPAETSEGEEVKALGESANEDMAPEAPARGEHDNENLISFN